jgi:hypothetical protein
MPLDEYKAQLITKILFAVSQVEVKQIIDEAIKKLEQNKVNASIIERFVDKIASELDLFNPMNKDAQQWGNIKIARILFFRIKKELENVVI